MAKIRKGKLIMSNADRDRQVSIGKRSTPDTRPDWRDPNMPVLRDYRMGDGNRKAVVDPDYERRYREMLMVTTPHLTYRDDPTYNLRKAKP